MINLAEGAKTLQALTGRQHNQLIKLHFPRNDGPDATLVANRLDAVETLSADFQFTVEVLSNDPRIPLKSVLGKLVTVELTRERGEPRYFSGYVFEFRFVAIEGGLAQYDMVLLPWLAFLRLRKDNHIFHGMTVREQTVSIFSDYDTTDWKQLALGTDPVMTDAVQFDESDYNYLHRRWEALGWHYWYEHRKDGHTLVLGGDSRLSDPIDAPGVKVPFHDEAHLSEDHGITQFTPVRRLSSTSVAATSFDFKKPRPQASEIPTVNQQGQVPALEVYEYAGAYGFATRDAGQAFVRLRMEEIEAAGKHFEAIGNLRGMMPGRWFRLVGHFDQQVMGSNTEDHEFLVIEVRHVAANNYGAGEATAAHYHNRLTCLRKKIPWRPSRGYNSIEPHIYGLQTAIVTGPKGAEIHSDEFGRVRVQFHWDRLGEFDEKSSAWVRVASTWAGSNFGFIAVPRIGQEVLVQFLDGNPDRPLITGRVYNAANMPPWQLPANQTQTGILSRSSQGGGYDNANALRFEDKKGSEEVWLHAEKNQRIEVENDESHWVGHDRDKVIDHDERVQVRHDRFNNIDVNHTEKIGSNHTETVGANHRQTIGRNQAIKIGKNLTETVTMANIQNVGMAKVTNVGLGYMVNVGAGYSVNVGGLANFIVGGVYNEQVGKSRGISAGENVTVKAGKTMSLTGADKITANGKEVFIEGSTKLVLSVGASSITLTPGEIKINAPLVKINCPAAPSSALAANTPVPKQQTGLGQDVDDIAAQSPTLQKDLADLKKDGWVIKDGPAGGGSHASRDQKVITIDSALKSDPKQATQVLAHEVGHAKYPFKDDRSGKAAFLKGTLGDEGAATMKNIEVQREIVKNGGPDIGIAGNPANHPKYNAAYDQYLKDGNAGAARDKIGQIFGNGERVSGPTNPTYNEYYGGWYDKHYPGRP